MLILEVRETCRSVINMLRMDLHHLFTKVSSLSSQASTLWDFHRHLKDLDNSNRAQQYQGPRPP